MAYPIDKHELGIRLPGLPAWRRCCVWGERDEEVEAVSSWGQEDRRDPVDWRKWSWCQRIKGNLLVQLSGSRIFQKCERCALLF